MKPNHQSAIHGEISRAHEAHKMGDLTKAEALYIQILSQEPLYFDALHMLGVVYAQKNELIQAVEFFKKALAVKSNDAILQFNLANAYIKTGQEHHLALNHLELSVKLNPNYFDALMKLGSIHLDLNNPKLAVTHFLQASKVNSTSPQAQLGLGRAYMALEDKKLALQAYEKALELKIAEKGAKTLHETSFDTFLDIGICLSSLVSPEKALEALNIALSIRPSDSKALFHKAISLRSLNQLNEALATFNELHQLNSENLGAIQGLAVVFQDIGRDEEALMFCKRALKLSPELATAQDTMGVILNSLKDFNNSIQHHLKAIELNPENGDFYLNLGYSLLSINQVKESKIAFTEAVRLNPNSLKAKWNLSTSLLKLGDFEDGWKNYSTRWELPELNLKPLITEKPQWALNLPCEHLLIWGEQGVGDEILFASLLDQACSNVSKVTVYLDGRLIPLIQRSFPKLCFITDPIQLATLDYDSQISIGDLSQHFCKSANDFAKIRPSYLVPDKTLSDQIAKAYKQSNKVLCGISWKSNNRKLGADRSVQLKELIKDINLPEFEFINLQYGDVTHDLEQVQQELGIKILQAKEVDNFSNIDGLAALIDACDLIISIDNTTVHIAGALGKPVWILLNRNPDWRWFLERSDSPWYPSATLFRQEIAGQWQTVLGQVKNKAIDILQGKAKA